MLTKYKDVRRLDPEKGVNMFFETVSCLGRIQNFFRGKTQNFSVNFFRTVTLTQIEKQK